MKIGNIEKDIVDKILNSAEKFFHTKNDSNQVQETYEAILKLQKLHPKSLIYKIDSRGNFIGSVTIIPTSKNLMNLFLNGAITEGELLKKSKPRKKYGAIYLLDAVILPKHRKKQHATKMFIKSINSIPRYKNFEIFYWPFSKAGERLSKKIADHFGVKIKKRPRF